MSPEEFHALYTRYGPAVRVRCRAMCGNHADADEALQEAFVKAWRARDRFDGRRPLAWLHAIARNVCIDLIRRRKPGTGEPEVWERIPAPSRVDPDARVDVDKLRASLGADETVLLRLRWGENWRIRELAEHFEMSERSLRRWLAQIERRASAILGVPLEVRHA